jgi:hypothetical protein
VSDHCCHPRGVVDQGELTERLSLRHLVDFH